MKLPDKIYIEAYEHYRLGTYLKGNTWVEDGQETDADDRISYIRKGALLKWLEAELKEASRSFKTIGRRNAYLQVIDKLNSM